VEDEGEGEGERVPDEFQPDSVQVADDTPPLPVEDEDNFHMDYGTADAQIEQAMDDHQLDPNFQTTPDHSHEVRFSELAELGML